MQPDAQSTELPLSRAEWELLVRLPRHVMLAAGRETGARSAGAAAGAGSTAASGTGAGGIGVGGAGAGGAGRAAGGIGRWAAAEAAIDAGRTATSQLVRGVVAVIRSAEAPPRSYTDRAVDQAGVLNECHVAAQLLHDRLPLADATAYEDWLLTVADGCASDTEFRDGLKRALTFT